MLNNIRIEKKCSKCGRIKALTEFHKDKHGKDDLSPFCKKCKSDKARNYYSGHSEHVKEHIRKRRSENPELTREYARKWALEHPEQTKAIARKSYYKNRDHSNKVRAMKYIQNPEAAKIRSRKWNLDNAEQKRTTNKKWRENNSEKVKSYGRKTMARYLSTPKGKLNNIMSCGINKSLLRKAKNNRHWETLVDFTIDQLKNHLEKLFEIGMTWDNKNEWHIDHIIPISGFNFETPDDIDFKRCWALKNLRPLWARENLSKGNRLNKPFQPCLLLKIKDKNHGQYG